MVRVIDRRFDVTEAAGLGEPAEIALTVHLPDINDYPQTPIVCFAKPGGGFSRKYYTCDLPGPGPGKGSQADWHAKRGWIFVSIDHIGVGESSQHDTTRLNFAVVTAASQAAELQLLQLLAEGKLEQDFPKVLNPVKIGLGQSMGACLTIVQQGRYRSYDGVGILGYSAIYTKIPTKPGQPKLGMPYYSHDTKLDGPVCPLNGHELSQAELTIGVGDYGTAMAWNFFWDDNDPQVVAEFVRMNSETVTAVSIPEWSSATIPLAAGMAASSPGSVAPEAAAITVPVLCAMGERDVVSDPKGEGRPYMSATSFDLYICPRMGHMHNFAGTRELFWRRIDTWVEWARELRLASIE